MANKYEGMNLEELREQIDAVDRAILDDFRDRMELSAMIAKVKKASGKPILDVDREKAKLDIIAKNVEDELAAYCSKLYLTLADLSKLYQSELFGTADNKLGDDDN